jgi:AcrR family transcriptional regulator
MARARPKSSATKQGATNGRTGRSAAREAEILDASVDIFHANGYSATSVEDVAQAVGILKGSLYYYIDSKEDLLVRIVEAVHDEVQKVMDDVLLADEGTPLERIAAYVRAQVDYNAHNIKRMRVYYHDYEQLSEERLSEVRKRRRAQEQAAIRVLQEAKEAGEIPADLDERLAAKSMFATILWMYTWYKPGGNVSAKGLADFCAKFVVDGVRGGMAPAAPKRRAPRAAAAKS